MSYTIVITAGQLSGSDIKRSIGKFSALTSPAFVGSKMQALSGHIDSYKKGEIDTDAFFSTLQGELQEGSEADVTIDEIREAWNAMSVIDETVMKELRALSILQERLGFDVVVVGRTNAAHHEFESQQLISAGIQLKFERVNSFSHGTLDINELLSRAELDREGVLAICFIRDVSLEFEKAKLLMCEVDGRNLSTTVESTILSDMGRPPLVRLSSKDRYGYGDSDNERVVAEEEEGLELMRAKVDDVTDPSSSTTRRLGTPTP